MNTPLIGTKCISDLANYQFYIPPYQRGYRWDIQQVRELLDDLWEFTKDPDSDEEKYCMQPLVVRPRGEAADLESCRKWEVVDGQQRLTTLAIVMQGFNNEAPYTITYDTAGKGRPYDIRNINVEDQSRDINLYYMRQAAAYVQNWKEKINDTSFLETLTHRVQFIWYATNEGKPVDIFARLNSGRIALSGAELIKALFLSSKNFSAHNSQVQEITQADIATQWDEIEARLQDDEFWLFFNSERPAESSTRIDALLKVVVQNNDDLSKISEDEVGNDRYSTFRRYHHVYKEDTKERFTKRWADIRTVYDTLTEWYNSSELYHYTGYLMATGVPFQTLYDQWKKVDNRCDFIRWMAENITEKIRFAQEALAQDKSIEPQTKAKPFLLLHNVVTVVKQNQVLITNEKYHMGVFYKLPFHLFKIENWDVEHIDSATYNALNTPADQINWLLSAYQSLNEEQRTKVKDDMLQFFQTADQQDQANISFDELVTTLRGLINIPTEDTDWKNKLQNYTLLDSSTNRGYKNALFPIKRNYIVGKEKGKLTIFGWDKTRKEITQEEVSFPSAFVMPCTKNVFLKTYSPLPRDFTRWAKEDADCYKKELEATLRYITEFNKQ